MLIFVNNILVSDFATKSAMLPWHDTPYRMQERVNKLKSWTGFAVRFLFSQRKPTKNSVLQNILSKDITLFKANYRTAPHLTVLIKLVIAANWIFTIYLTPFANLTIKKDIIWNAFYFFKK